MSPSSYSSVPQPVAEPGRPQSPSPVQHAPVRQPAVRDQPSPPPSSYQARALASDAASASSSAGRWGPATPAAARPSVAPDQASPDAGWQSTAAAPGPSWASTHPAPSRSAAAAPPPAAAAPVVGSWGSAPAVEDEVPAAPPWGALTPKTGAASTAWEPQGSSRATDVDLDDDDDDEIDERPAHPYTWLQLIVLALVAFVLGFLIVLLANKDDGAEAAAQSAPAAVEQASTSHPDLV